MSLPSPNRDSPLGSFSFESFGSTRAFLPGDASIRPVPRVAPRPVAPTEETERLFRDWTVHLAGEPGERLIRGETWQSGGAIRRVRAAMQWDKLRWD